MAGYDGLARGEPLLLLLQPFNYRFFIAQRATFAYKNVEPFIRSSVQLSTVQVIVHRKSGAQEMQIGTDLEIDGTELSRQ